MNQRWRRLHDEVTCQDWLCQLTLAGPWFHHVTLHRCPSSNIGQPQASASGQANIISSQTFSRLSHKSHQKQYAQKIWVKTVRKISFQEGRLTGYLDWRQYYVIWRPVASLASWPRVSCGHQHIMAPVVSGQGTRSQGGKEADQGPPVTWVTRHEEGFEAGERLRGLCLWTGAWLRTEAGTSDRELRLRAPASAAHPQLWSHRQARTRTLPTKYSRFFSPLKCVLNLLSFSLKSSRTQRIPVPNSAQRGQRRFGGSYSDRQGWYGYKFQETLIVSHVILNARNMVEECEVPGHLTSDHEGAMWGVCECLASGHQGDPEEIEAGCWQTQH